MTGFVVMARQWQDHTLFEGDEFSRRDAWAWLIANAAWKSGTARIKGQVIELARGELCFAQRFLAAKWGWSKSRVDRFLSLLREEGMIATRSKIGATADHKAGQGQTIITICNYERFQTGPTKARGNNEPQIGATAGQQRGKEEQGNKGTIEEEPRPRPIEEGQGDAKPKSAYAYKGKTIRLIEVDFAEWVSLYHAIPDLRAELAGLDRWFQRQTDAVRQDWYFRTSNSLNRKHQEMLKAAATAVSAGEPASFLDHVAQRRREEQAYRERQQQGVQT